MKPTAYRFFRTKACNRTVAYCHATFLGVLGPRRPIDASFGIHGGNCPTLLDTVRSRLLAAELAFLTACHIAQIIDKSTMRHSTCGDTVLRILKRGWDDMGDSGHERTGPRKLFHLKGKVSSLTRNRRKRFAMPCRD
ncbi:hypothetical protein EDB83DRAFT_2437678 [Lactarius deliciosus]|nr:hypothetical protein EDB83DRAFT_2437678 [Lactarius deliciosus]